MNIRTTIIALFATGGLILSSCADTDAGNESSASVDATESFNDADVMFAQMMIPHHEQAIEMSDIALDPAVGAGASVITLATRIKAGQDPEIQLMIGLLGRWGKPVAPDDMMDHGAMMGGMLSLAQLDELGALSGEAFDRQWIEYMIEHHLGAITMAEAVLADGTNLEVRDLAEAIVEAQRAEIADMETLLGR